MGADEFDYADEYDRIEAVIADSIKRAAKSLGVEVSAIGNWVVVLEALTASDDANATNTTLSVMSPSMNSRDGVLETANVLLGGLSVLRKSVMPPCPESDA